jgi:Bacterial PH domain
MFVRIDCSLLSVDEDYKIIAWAMTHFRAPWSKSLIVASTFATLVCLGVSYALWTLPLRGGSAESLRFSLVLLPLTVILICALFTVRGYSISNRELAIHRLFWTTGVSLKGLQAVYFDPDATRRSIRTFGNGGFFSFTGYFRNKQLGSYRAFMTDRRRAVVIRFSDSVIVVSPDRPEDFVNTISQYNVELAQETRHPERN